MRKITAFTLGETLIVIGIIGVIAALLLPTINQIQPDRHKVLFKKAYSTIDRIVTELVNDDALYPEAMGSEGFDNTTTDLGITSAALTGIDANTKFCRLFAYKVNTVTNGTVNCPATLTNGSASGSGSTPSFTTTDGIEFYIPSSTFATPVTISVDVNGEKEPNCKFNATTCKMADRFEVIVAADGGISVTGTMEQAYLKTTSVAREAN